MQFIPIVETDKNDPNNCYGGCTKDRIKDSEDHRRLRFCTTTKMFLKHADPTLKIMAEQWKAQQATQYETQ